MEKVEWKVEGMTCTNCALSINKFLEKQGAQKVVVDFIGQDVSFELNDDISKENLAKGQPISVVYPGRTFRNEDVDARHEHTFYQVELSYIGKDIHAGQLVATIKSWFTSYYNKELEVRIQPFYFPFTEPSAEMDISCLICGGTGCNVCKHTGWVEILGCGMVHPNVLKAGNVDPEKYTGFAFGWGVERALLMKDGIKIDDLRTLYSNDLDFLKQF